MRGFHPLLAAAAFASTALLPIAPTFAQAAGESPSAEQEPAPIEVAPLEVQAAEPAKIDAARLALAREIIDLGMPEDTREATFFATMDQVTAQMRASMLDIYGLDDPGLLEILDTWTEAYVAKSKVTLREHIPLLVDGMAKSYAVMFSHKELSDIREFVGTDSGQRFFQLSPALVGEPNFAAANQNYMNAVNAELPAAMEQLRAAIVEHLQSREAAADPDET